MLPVNIPIYFIKAVQKKTITVPGYTRRNGTYVPPHTKVVMFDPNKDVASVVSGSGSHSQKTAHKKLHAKHGGFKHLPDDEQHAHILALATDIQAQMSSSAAVSMWKKAALAGKNPTASSWAAFNALPHEKQAELEQAVESAAGTAHLVNPQQAAAPVAPAAKEPEPAVEAKPKTGEVVWTGTGANNMTAKVVVGAQGKFNAVLVDGDSGQTVGVQIYKDAAKAQAKAEAWLTGKPAAGPHVSPFISAAVHAGIAASEGAQKKEERTKAFLAALGKDGKPEVVTGALGGDVMYRAINPEAGKSAEDFAQEFLTGELRIGSGFLASGIYAATGADAKAHAAYWGNEPGAVLVAMKPKLGAVVKTREQLQTELADGYAKDKKAITDVVVESIEAGVPNTQAMDDLMKLEAAHDFFSKDLARYAAAVGVDVISEFGETKGDSKEAVVVNRGAMRASAIVEPVVAPAEEGKAQKPATASPGPHDAEAKLAELLSGMGSHYAVKAAKKLDGAWASDDPVARLEQVLALGKEMQAAASASAAVSGYKKSIAGGKAPTKAQLKAFFAQPDAKQVQVLQGLIDAHGSKHVGDMHNAAMAAHGVTQLTVNAELAAAPAEPSAQAEPSAPAAPAQGVKWPVVESMDPYGGMPMLAVTVPGKLTDAQFKSVSDLVEDYNGIYSKVRDGGDAEQWGFHFMEEYEAHEFAEAVGAMDWSSASDSGPKDGDTKQGADGTLVFQNGRWHKQQQDKPEQMPQTLDGWKAALLSGQKPTARQTKAYLSADLDQADKALDAVKAAIGVQKFQDLMLGPAKWAVAEQVAVYSGAQEWMVQSPGGLASAHFDAAVAAADLGGGYYVPDGQGAGTFTFTSKLNADVFAEAMATYGSPVTNAAIPDAAETWAYDTATQKGSNPGGLYTDKAGVKWYVKVPKSESHARNELLAAKLYEAAGVAGPDLKLVVSNGKTAVASRWVDGLAKEGVDIKEANGALEGFAVDAWLANYDSVGTGYDNLLRDAAGNAVRIDVGGSLMYRAQGLPKTDFGSDVHELDGMKDPNKNHFAAAVFGGITPEQMTAGATKVASVTPEMIQALVQQYGPGTAAEKAALADTIIARRATLLAAHPVAQVAKPKKAKKAPPDPTKLKVDASQLPPKPNFHSWGSTGSPLSSVPSVNDANQAAADEIEAAAKVGNLVAVKALDVHLVDKTTGAVSGTVPAGSHPSQHVKNYYSDVVSFMDIIANPAAKMKAWAGKTVKTIAGLSKAFPAHLYGIAVGDVPASHRLGFWVSLGSAKASKLVPTSTHTVTAADEVTGKASVQGMPTKLRQWLAAVKSSGSANTPYRDGEEYDSVGNKTREVLAAAYAHAVEFEAGTVIRKGISLPPAMLAAMHKLPLGHVFQNPGSMCCSKKENWSWHGDADLEIVYAKGAKALWNMGVGSFNSEEEITTLPGQRFMLLEKKTHGAGNYGNTFKLLMLPPDPNYVANIGNKQASDDAKAKLQGA